jgi:hypothetical protein
MVADKCRIDTHARNKAYMTPFSLKGHKPYMRFTAPIARRSLVKFVPACSSFSIKAFVGPNQALKRDRAGRATFVDFSVNKCQGFRAGRG